MENRVDFSQILDRARELKQEVSRGGSKTMAIKVAVGVDPSVGDAGTTAVPKCVVTVTADSAEEAKAAKDHLEGEDHKCNCWQFMNMVGCVCP